MALPFPFNMRETEPVIMKLGPPLRLVPLVVEPNYDAWFEVVKPAVKPRTAKPVVTTYPPLWSLQPGQQCEELKYPTRYEEAKYPIGDAHAQSDWERDTQWERVYRESMQAYREGLIQSPPAPENRLTSHAWTRLSYLFKSQFALLPADCGMLGISSEFSGYTVASLDVDSSEDDTKCTVVLESAPFGGTKLRISVKRSMV